MLPENTAAPCAGKWELFDSVDAADHAEAKALCDICPHILACARELGLVKQGAGIYGHPEGTWAGRLERPRHWRTIRDENSESRNARIVEEDALYDHEQSRIAHNAYSAGDRTEWARVGHRVYQRNVKRRQRDGAA